ANSSRHPANRQRTFVGSERTGARIVEFLNEKITVYRVLGTVPNVNTVVRSDSEYRFPKAQLREQSGELGDRFRSPRHSTTCAEFERGTDARTDKDVHPTFTFARPRRWKFARCSPNGLRR